MSVRRSVKRHLRTTASTDAQTTREEHCARASALAWVGATVTRHRSLRTDKHHVLPERLAKIRDGARYCLQAHPDLVKRAGIEVDSFADQKDDIAGVLPRRAEVVARPLDSIMGAICGIDDACPTLKRRAHGFLDDPDSARFVCIGDRPPRDVVGVARVGFTMSALLDGGRGEVTESKDDSPPPDDTIRSFCELLAIL